MFQVEGLLDLLHIGFRDRHERRSSTSCLVLHSKNRVSWSFAVSTGEKYIKFDLFAGMGEYLM